MIRLLALFLGAALAMAGCARPDPPGVVTLTYATPYPPSHPFSKADITWMKWVEQESAGKLRIRPAWAGSVLSSDMSMEELRHGVADIGLVTPIYVRGGSQLIRTQAGFYAGVTSIKSQVALYHCMEAVEPRLRQEVAGLRILAIQGGSLPGLITRRRPVHSLADLRGLRLRAPAELLGVLARLGADPVNMPMGEVYSAMAKGVIDGVVAPGDTFKALHFSEVARYYTDLKVPRGAYPARAMNLARYNALPPQDRALLDRSRTVWEEALAKEINGALSVGFDDARANGITIIPLKPGDQQKFEALYRDFAARDAAALRRVGLDGTRAFDAAKASAVGNDQVQCKTGRT